MGRESRTRGRRDWRRKLETSKMRVGGYWPDMVGIPLFIQQTPPLIYTLKQLPSAGHFAGSLHLAFFDHSLESLSLPFIDWHRSNPFHWIYMIFDGLSFLPVSVSQGVLLWDGVRLEMKPIVSGDWPSKKSNPVPSLSALAQVSSQYLYLSRSRISLNFRFILYDHLLSFRKALRPSSTRFRGKYVRLLRIALI